MEVAIIQYRRRFDEWEVAIKQYRREGEVAINHCLDSQPFSPVSSFSSLPLTSWMERHRDTLLYGVLHIWSEGLYNVYVYS